jgi:hypothetical protein
VRTNIDKSSVTVLLGVRVIAAAGSQRQIGFISLMPVGERHRRLYGAADLEPRNWLLLRFFTGLEFTLIVKRSSEFYLDMVGSKRATFRQEGYSLPLLQALVRDVWNTAIGRF